eukprot:gene16444-22663_t
MINTLLKRFPGACIAWRAYLGGLKCTPEQLSMHLAEAERQRKLSGGQVQDLSATVNLGMSRKSRESLKLEALPPPAD